MDSRKLKDDSTYYVRPWCVPPWLLVTLSTAALMASLVSFTGTAVFWYHGFHRNKSGIIASGLIGIILLLAGIFGNRIAIHQRRQPESFATESSLKSSYLLRVIAIVFSLPTLLGAIDFIWRGLTLLNGTHLNWFDTNVYYADGDTSISSEMWSSFVVGELLFLTTIFLWWFAFIKGRSRSDLLTRYMQSKKNDQDPATPEHV